MPPIDPKTTKVQIALDYDGEPGEFVDVEDATGYSASHGSEDAAEIRVFGKEAPYVIAGELVDDYAIDGLLNLENAEVQNILRASRNQGMLCWIQILPDGANGELQQCNVNEWTHNATADGEAVEVSFSLNGIVGTYEEVTVS